MSRRLKALLGAAFLLAAGLSGAAAVRAQSAGKGSCDELLSLVRKQTALFRDLRLDVEITQQNQKELATISDDFGKAYEFKRSKLVFRSPDSFKVSAKAGVVNVSYIVSGNTKIVRAGFINKKTDISKTPHKKQIAIDAGILDETFFKQYTVRDCRRETLDGRSVYKVTAVRSNAPDKEQYTWVDASDLRLLKREKREADGSLIARHVYTKHKLVGGLWVPGEMRVYGRNEKLAGTSVYTNARVNSGVEDKEFR